MNGHAAGFRAKVRTITKTPNIHSGSKRLKNSRLSSRKVASPDNKTFSLTWAATMQIYWKKRNCLQEKNGSLSVLAKLPTYPSPKPTFCPK